MTPEPKSPPLSQVGGERHTRGQLTVRVVPAWPFDIEIRNAADEVVFTDRMPCHSSQDRTLDDCLTGRHFKLGDQASVREINGRAIADAHLRAAAPEMYDALKAAVECGLVPVTSASDGGAARHSSQVRVADQIRAAISKATEGRG